MTHIEIKSEFEKRIFDAKEKILNAKNGDMLSAKISLYYINDKFEESDSYDEKSDTSLVSSLMVFVKGAESEEDLSYEISLLCDLKGGCVKDPDELKKEFNSFDSELGRFLSELSSAESAEELIKAEDSRINEEGKKLIADLEASISKLKKLGIIVGIVLLAFLIIMFLIK